MNRVLAGIVVRVALLAACLPAVAHAQSSVWKVTRGNSTIYLGGTVHLLRKEDFPLPEEFDQAFAASDELCFEVDIAEMQSPAGIGLLLRGGVLPGDETLESVLSPEAWRALADYCAETGLSLATMSRFKPGVLMMNIQVFEYTKLGLSQQGVEMFFAERARQHGKRTLGLETVAEQFGFIEVLGGENPSELVLQTIRDLHQTGPMLVTAIAAWRSGNLRTLDRELLRKMAADAPDVAEKLIYQRNRNWVPRIEAMFASEAVEFVLVGAGHLPGRKGLLALLKARGCRITQLVAKRK